MKKAKVSTGRPWFAEKTSAYQRWRASQEPRGFAATSSFSARGAYTREAF